MKKILSLFAAGALLFAACCKDTAETPTKSITFSSSALWNTNVTLAASNGTSTISSVAINNVPIQRNRSTEYSGNLFTNNGSSTLTLNDTWDDPINGTW